MIFSYIICAIILIKTFHGIRKAVSTIQYAELLPLLLFIPFHVFFISTLILGGSAFNNAPADYDLYQEGCYYLCSHGRYTEVTYGVYLYAKIIEIVGTIFFAVGFVVGFIRSNKKENLRLLNQNRKL